MRARRRTHGTPHRGTPSRTLRALVTAGTILAAGACTDAFFFDPASAGPGTLAMRWDAALGGPGEAFDEADNLRVRLVAPGTQNAVHDEEVPLDGAGTLSISVELEEDEATFQMEVDVRTGSVPLFTASQDVVLRPGETTPVTLQLAPVADALAIPPSYPVLTAYGDTVLLGGAVVFATGDTIPGRVPSWSTLDPEVVEVGQRSDGRWYARALSDGEARMSASADGFQESTTVDVLAEVVEVGVSPASVELPVDGEAQLSATATDRNGNPIPGRATDWTSGNSMVASVDLVGLVRGEAPGETQVTAEVDGVMGSAEVAVFLDVPVVETRAATGVGAGMARLNGSVDPRGNPTQAWFEWGTDPALANAQETDAEAVGDGEVPVDVDAVLTDLPPSTTFYFRVVGASTAGESPGDVLSFQTPDPPAAPSGLSLSVDGGVFVRWTDNSQGEAGFEVERAVTAPAAAGGAARPGAAQQADFERIAVVDPGVEEFFDEEPPTGRLTYRVRACSPDGCSPYTPPVSIDFASPPVVTTAVPSDVGPSSAVLVGTVDPRGSSTEAWFLIALDPGFSSPFETPRQDVGSGTGLVGFDQLVENLPAGTTFYYRAIAVNAGGTGEGFTVSFTTPDIPAAPLNLEADYGEGDVLLGWDDVSGNESHFEVQRAVGSGPYQNLPSAPADSEFYSDFDPPDGLLRYRVRACNADGCSAFAGPASISWPGEF